MIQFDNAVERFNKLILDELTERGIKVWIAGGVVRDYFLSKTSESDIDLFFPDKDNWQKCYDYLTKEGGNIIWESENGCKMMYSTKKFDLVKKFFATPQETIDVFDFTVSQFAVDSEKVYHGETSFIDLAKKQLMINKLPYPASTMRRLLRYYLKGFKICDGELRKIIEALQEKALKEALEGLINKDIKKEDKVIDDQEIESSGNGFFAGID